MVNLFTQDEVRRLARRAGFNRRNAKIASAIAMCESAYSRNGVSYANFDAVGDKALANRTWGYSYGGFQIRSLKSHTGTGKIRDASRLLDPEFNARSARAIKLAQGWRAWSVFTSGAYKAYLPDMYPPAPNTYVVRSGDTLGGIARRLGVSWTDLARWNNIRSPYNIYIGQTLLTQSPGSY